MLRLLSQWFEKAVIAVIRQLLLGAEIDEVS